jgi:hypothetical protein
VDGEDVTNIIIRIIYSSWNICQRRSAHRKARSSRRRRRRGSSGSTSPTTMLFFPWSSVSGRLVFTVVAYRSPDCAVKGAMELRSFGSLERLLWGGALAHVGCRRQAQGGKCLNSGGDP